VEINFSLQQKISALQRKKEEQQVREIPEETGIFRGTLDEKWLSIPILHAEHEKL